MPILYFNNFRGFKETFLPLKKVNFFVGENSTGKTSVLKLIKIISEPDFLFQRSFESHDADLGYFKEIVSVTNPHTNFFEIGALKDYAEHVDLLAFKIKYIDHQCLPIVQELNLLTKRINLQIIIDKQSIKYRFKPVEIKEDEVLDYFTHWVLNNELVGKFKTTKNILEGKEVSLFNLLVYAMLPEMQDYPKDILSLTKFDFIERMYWIAPIRTEPKRTYDNYKSNFNPDGTHTPYVLRKLLGNKPNVKKNIEDILTKFGEESGLFNKIEIKSLGKEENSPFEIFVYINGNPHKITNVGYGVSQVLPLLIEIIYRKKESWFAIQQPEIHLHPKAQAAFGSLVFQANVNYNHRFIIETHSDYTIDRYRLHISNLYDKQPKSETDSQVVFFDRCKNGNKLSCIPILNDGTYSENQPDNFRDFFITEQMNLLQI